MLYENFNGFLCRKCLDYKYFPNNLKIYHLLTHNYNIIYMLPK